MSVKSMIRRIVSFLLWFIFPAGTLLAASESYVQTLEGNIGQGNVCTVVDDKFQNLSLVEWNQVNHLSVDNIVSFELRFDTPNFYYNTSFTCSLTVTIKYFTSRDQQTPQEINNVNLVVKYDKTSGSKFPVVAYHKFKNAFKVTVEVNSITSQELGQNIPPIFRLKNQIIVERKYPFNPEVTVARLGLDRTESGNSRQLVVSWNTPDFNNSEEYDVEWAFIDASSEAGQEIASTYTVNGVVDIPDNKVEEWMRNDNTRVTVPGNTYTLNLPYSDGYVLTRVRGAYYQLIYYAFKNEQVPLRRFTNWVYKNGDNKTAIEPITAHEPGLNWQYTAVFAEEGKRKEVVAYADGSLRNRQLVTLSNSDQTLAAGSTSERQETAIVQETVYDEMGRAAMNILPAPVRSKSLTFYPQFNRNSGGQPLSQTDIGLNTGSTSCDVAAGPLDDESGASNYYSAKNRFLEDGLDNVTRNVPKAEGYPYTLTQYTPDNSGRVRRKGGVGSALQIGSGHEIQYYYAKPAQKELDRMFGVEAGDASHYLKNMIVDPNGQISFSYLNAKGRVVATSLAGASPANVDSLPSSRPEVARVKMDQTLIGAADFLRDAGALQMQASATFAAAVTGDFEVHYSINPAAITTTHPQGQFCNTCAYEVIIEVRDDCGLLRGSGTSTAFTWNEVTCNANAAPVTGMVPVDVRKIGEYTVSYTLRLSEQAVNYQVDYYINNNSSLKKLQTFFEEELRKLNLAGCYTTCEECKLLGSTPDTFRNKVVELLSTDKFAEISIGAAGSPVNLWIDSTWAALRVKCDGLAASCTANSACDTYLEQMKSDVKPGGQYALYNPTTFQYMDRSINVLRYYNLDTADNAEIYNLSYVDEAGTTIVVRNLPEADFIKAYQQHPEWADLFVKKHIEYCSYLWCKDGSFGNTTYNNEASYNFDQYLRESITTGAQAIGKNYYNRGDIAALVKEDPFFKAGRGVSYKDEMEADLNNLSVVLGVGSSLPGKNAFAYIDWNLYCKPAELNTSEAAFLSSWTGCTPDNGCRSVTREWELYRNYYLQLKSKYMHLVKEQTAPLCRDCFIGKDVLVQSECTPPVLSDFSIGTTMGRHGAIYHVVYKQWTLPFEDNYLATVQYTLNGNTVTENLSLAKGDLDHGFHDTYEGEITNVVITSITCARSGALLGCGGYNGDPGPCPTETDLAIEYVERPEFDFWTPDRSQSYSRNVVLVLRNGPLNRPVTVTAWHEIYSYVLGWDQYLFDVTIPAGETRVVLGLSMETWEDIIDDNMATEEEITSYSYGAYLSTISCPPVPPKPQSTCADDPKFAAYSTKKRIFNDYVAMDTYLACSVPSTPPPSLPTEAGMLQELRTQAIAELQTLRGNWATRLLEVKNNEPTLGGISDASINSLVEALYQVAVKSIEVAQTKDAIKPASTLPTSPQMVYSSLGHNSFTQAFQAIIGTTWMQQGFSPYLLDKPYPYKKAPVEYNPNTGELNANLCGNLTQIKQLHSLSGGGQTLHAWLKAKLGDDFVLTPTQLSDLENRCANSCQYLDEPLVLPAALGGNIPENGVYPFASCESVSTLQAAFNTQFSGLSPTSKLYRILYTNFMNHQLGYALSMEEYAEFAGSCTNQVGDVLFNKAVYPLIVQDYLACVAPALKNAYEHAGQDFERYIALERARFRNEYVATCIDNSATARIKGDQYEYHFTLYYYDQSNNLVKTIPPEGVHLLSVAETDQVQEFRGFTPASCTGSGIPTTENKTATFNALSSALQTSTGSNALEMWLYSSNNSSSRQVRIVTPDKKYFYQAAIHDNKLWVELYSLNPGTTDVEISLTNHAVADIGPNGLQTWSHLVVQGVNFKGAPWDLYLDGRKLTLIPLANEPPYPFEWEIAAGFTTPAEESALLKHLRLYSNTLADHVVYANYKSSCLSPGVAGLPMVVWGRFNIPPPGSETTTGPNTTTEYVNRFIVPQHGLPTNYVYNSLNQEVAQTSPDAGLVQTWYDRLGRPVLSQTAEQRDPLHSQRSPNEYGYIKYDVLGRVVETGYREAAPGSVTESSARDNQFLTSFYSSGYKRHVKRTIYDLEPGPAYGNQWDNLHLRHRIASTIMLTDAEVQNGVAHQTFYSYDISGNVKKLGQYFPLSSADWFGAEIKYDYDLISGKVNQVAVNAEGLPIFYYQYLYDADNRMVEARSSQDKLIWTTDATYRYYLHGPLARTELGHYKVQGLDYAYTLQGWMKGINSHRLDVNADMGQDGKAGTPFSGHARDVMAFGMGHFANDYSPVGAGTAFGLQYQFAGNTGDSLFNGNISHTTLALSKLDNGAVKGYTYRYDQLHRLRKMRMHTIDAANTWSNSSIIAAYKEDIEYDANGNILQYARNGNDPAHLLMDNLSYQYNRDGHQQLLNNKLTHVTDAVPDGHYADIDIDNQPANAYSYDRDGNLIKDEVTKIPIVWWYPDGKMQGLVRLTGDTAGVENFYTYDAAGNRVIKRNYSWGIGHSGYQYDFYIRDAAGHVLAVYKATDHPSSGNLARTEQYLYGSTRLGVWEPDPAEPANTLSVGQRSYELSNHLGNVLATISDKKTGIDTDNNGQVDHYEAEVLSASDYYPFGMSMPGRKWGASDYRFGFNGKENDDEIKGEGIQQDYGMRIYDARLGRFLSVDPIAAEYPWNSTYAFAENDVIRCVDLDGQERYYYWRFKDDQGKTVLALSHVEDIVEYTTAWKVTARYNYYLRMVVLSSTLETKTHKNERQEYIVMQEDERMREVQGNVYLDEFDEQVTYKTYEAASQATDEDFNNTEADKKAHDLDFLAEIIEETEKVRPFIRQTGGKKGGKTRSKYKPTRNQFQNHHIIVERLARTSKFVMKAIKGGWDINALRNLTPIERYLTKNGLGRHAKHPAYTTQIQNHLDKLKLSDYTPKEAGEYLNQLGNYILKQIKANPNVKINDLDLKLNNFQFKR